MTKRTDSPGRWFSRAKPLTIALISCVLFSSNVPVSASSTTQSPDTIGTTLKVGAKAPDFTRFTSTGRKLSLKEFRNKVPVILYFYPQDETPNCIKEACGFRNVYDGLKSAGAEIIGVSGDNDVAHQAFTAHYSLPFNLISDSDNSLLELYRVPFFKGSLHKRVTFVIDKHGTIVSIVQYTNDGDVHVREALAALKLLAGKK